MSIEGRKDNRSYNIPDFTGARLLVGSSIPVYTTATHANIRMDNLGSGNSNCAYLAIRTDAITVAYGRHPTTGEEYTYMDTNLSGLPTTTYIIKF